MMGRFTHSDSRSSIELRHGLLALVLLLPGTARAQFPEGPGKAEMVKVCSGCHEIERSAAMHQDRDAWRTTFDKMIALGAKGTDAEMTAALDYLVRNFPAEEVPRLNVNKATAIELESRLSLKRSEAAAVIQYREKSGPFKSVEDLKKVPGIDAAKIEAKKDRLTF
jgi:competence protein ComEA